LNFEETVKRSGCLPTGGQAVVIAAACPLWYKIHEEYYPMKTETSSPFGLSVKPEPPDILAIELTGSWTLSRDLPDVHQLFDQMAGFPNRNRLVLRGHRIVEWNSGLLMFLHGVLGRCRSQSLPVTVEAFPEGVERLLELASANPPRPQTADAGAGEPWMLRIGLSAMAAVTHMAAVGIFIGELALSAIRLVAGKRRFRSSDFAQYLWETGANALPIVCLISLLVGVVMAFVGAVQLRLFGAQIFVADLVGLAMAREMGPMMTGVVLAGRTGAAFAAQLGTMQVNDEIDALKTLGVSPIDFLVLPRMVALMLMMPLLCVYADLMGILGGLLVGVVNLDIAATQYLEQTRNAVGIGDFTVGIAKSVVFAVVVAGSGCFRGVRSGKSASAVGEAATAAVVSAILYIVIFDALITVVCDAIGA
jgi:phospholipid/cholesterol/gamma-HCH transport system permease protein